MWVFLSLKLFLVVSLHQQLLWTKSSSRTVFPLFPWWPMKRKSSCSAALSPTVRVGQWSLSARLVWCMLGQCEGSSGGTWSRVCRYTPIYTHAHWCKQKLRQKRPCCVSRGSSAGSRGRSDLWPHDPDIFPWSLRHLKSTLEFRPEFKARNAEFVSSNNGLHFLAPVRKVIIQAVWIDWS